MQLHQIQVTEADIAYHAAAITIGGIQSWRITPEGAARLKVYNDLNRLHAPGWRAPQGNLSTFKPHRHLESDHPADLGRLLEWLKGWPAAVGHVRITAKGETREWNRVDLIEDIEAALAWSSEP
jgi:hypothetical protein